MTAIPEITVSELLARYDVLLLDAYGVLVSHTQPLPGSAELIDHLDAEHCPYYVLSNDFSRLPSTTSADFRQMGLDIPAARIINSTTVLGAYFERERLQGSACLVLGPPDCRAAVEESGGRTVALGEDFEVLIIGDEEGFPFVETIDTVITELFRRFDADRPVRLLLPNPDLVYPKRQGEYGITSGCVAALLEAPLMQRYPTRDDVRFLPLGKPHPLPYELALRQAGTENAVMIGDQLATDILGANRVGIDSTLVTTGVSRPPEPNDSECRPTWIMNGLRTLTGPG